MYVETVPIFVYFLFKNFPKKYLFKSKLKLARTTQRCLFTSFFFMSFNLYAMAISGIFLEVAENFQVSKKLLNLIFLKLI